MQCRPIGRHFERRTQVVVFRRVFAERRLRLMGCSSRSSSRGGGGGCRVHVLIVIHQAVLRHVLVENLLVFARDATDVLCGARPLQTKDLFQTLALNAVGHSVVQLLALRLLLLLTLQQSQKRSLRSTEKKEEKNETRRTGDNRKTDTYILLCCELFDARRRLCACERRLRLWCGCAGAFAFGCGRLTAPAFGAPQHTATSQHSYTHNTK